MKRERYKGEAFMKKLITLLTFCFLLVITQTVNAASPLAITYDGTKQQYTNKQLKVNVNGKNVDITSRPGILIDGVAMIPYKTVYNSKLGLATQYDNKTGNVTIVNGKKTIVLNLNSKTAIVNGVEKQLSVAPKAVKYEKSGISLILVPANFTSKQLGLAYSYSNGTVSVSKPSGKELRYGGKTVWYQKKTVNMIVDGKAITYQSPGYIFNNYAMIPVKKIMAELGGTYSYANKEMILTKGDNAIKMTIGSKTADVNGVKKAMPEAAWTVTDVESGFACNMVPASFLAANLGVGYNWNNSTVTVAMATDESGEDIPNGGDIEGDYNVMIPLAQSVAANSYKVNDDYHGKKFIITIPGDHLEFYAANKPVISDKAVNSITPKLNKDGDTELTLTTSSIRGFYINEANNALNIRVGKPSDIYKKIVVIDAGHGGTDSGAVGNSIKEKDINLKIQNCAKKYFDQDDDIKVYYTRIGDSQANMTAGSSLSSSNSLASRYNFANSLEADLFISVHINSSSNTTARGTEVYYCASNNRTNAYGTKASVLATTAYNNLVAAVGSTKRGVKTANFAVIRYTNMPAILMETAFISNASDAAILKNQSKLDQIGKSIYNTVKTTFANSTSSR